LGGQNRRFGGVLTAVSEMQHAPEKACSRAAFWDGRRFSGKIVRGRLERDPEAWMPVFGKDHAQGLKHDPEKWIPVLGKDHVQGL
jgi:hypothetical protein